MRNLFYPLYHEIDNVSPLTITANTEPTVNMSTQTNTTEYSIIYNIPFFSALFFPKVYNQPHVIMKDSGNQTITPNSDYKTLFYYQTFSSFHSLINLKLVTKNDIYVYISSVHFGIIDNKPYIGINNTSIDNQGSLWDDAIKAHENNINIMLMLGGAGGAYTALFSNFELYYNLLYELLNERRYIKGIDLDIEESITLDNVKLLIRRLKQDFGKDFIITMAPVASSMMYDMPGMGNFIYKDLHNSAEGDYIDWYNVQSYEEYTFDIYNAIINNGFCSNKS